MIGKRRKNIPRRSSAREWSVQEIDEVQQDPRKQYSERKGKGREESGKGDEAEEVAWRPAQAGWQVLLRDLGEASALWLKEDTLSQHVFSQLQMETPEGGVMFHLTLWLVCST